MTSVWKWFEDRRTAAEKREEAVINTRYHARRSNSNKVILLITEHNLDVNKDCLDEYQNTLLHIAVKKHNYRLVKSLVTMGANIYLKNMYGETPCDIATNQNDMAMIRTLLDLDTAIDALKTTNTELQRECGEVRAQLNVVTTENKSLKRKRKRSVCDECVVKERDIKRFKHEIGDITEQKAKIEKDNADLKTTVASLRESFKKQ
jgi:ankyrin repeat protein